MRVSLSSLWIVAVLVMASAPLHATVLDAEVDTVSLSGVWALQVDDNPAWAAPDVDDSVAGDVVVGRADTLQAMATAAQAQHERASTATTAPPCSWLLFYFPEYRITA